MADFTMEIRAGESNQHGKEMQSDKGKKGSGKV
ncbi:hypothetical protein COLO4_35229 [Corchorus olitorius]|uniref:Uncharacterized protein n=1 Tax=Corchorus olitorius TaxID=93759 RepID=A0A1R3GHS1_9ROSI|nr:hypothetical protein COLO4_35229 [Corchorus olitorius]